MQEQLIPQDTIRTVDGAIGRLAKFGLYKDQILTAHSLDGEVTGSGSASFINDAGTAVIPVDLQRLKVVYATRCISKGHIFGHLDLDEVDVVATKAPYDCISLARLVIGRRAKYDIAAGAVVSQQDLSAR